jgi:tetraacyldisaccharide 4'-kinase
MLRWLLFPLSALYSIVLYVRHFMYDKGILASKKFDKPVLVIGNLALGGSGKTPHTEYVLDLNLEKTVAVLSRGYGRKTSGYKDVLVSSSADEVGDEPLQIKRRFSNHDVAVCEDRVTGIQKLLDKGAETVILDDAFQHRKLTPGMSVLLLKYREKGRDTLLPVGGLRDVYSRVKKADTIVITKCPDTMTGQQCDAYRARFGELSERVHFSKLMYGTPQHVFSDAALSAAEGRDIILVTGIADSSPLLKYCREQGKILHHTEFKDHHAYTASDIQRLKEIFDSFDGRSTVILTTAKDAVKIRGLALNSEQKELPIYTVPIRVEFISDNGKFDEKIKTYVR